MAIKIGAKRWTTMAELSKNKPMNKRFIEVD